MRTEYKGYTIIIDQDPEPMNPRTEYDNATTMVCFHNRYDLGDEDHGFSSSDYNSWFQMEIGIRNRYDGQIAALLPVYMYDHSGLTIKTTPFECPWDSGQIGFVFMTHEQAWDCWGPHWEPEQCRRVCVQEVEAYDKYLRGDICCFIIEKDGEQVDSCFGFDDVDYCLQEAKNHVDSLQVAEDPG